MVQGGESLPRVRDSPVPEANPEAQMSCSNLAIYQRRVNDERSVLLSKAISP